MSMSSSDSEPGGAAEATRAASVGGLLRSATLSLREAGSESPRLDAELLLGHVLGVGRATLLAEPESPVGGDHRAAFEALVERRATGEPVAYIRGLKEFYGLALAVDGRALIPRPETELLVELAVERLGWLLTAAPRPVGSRPLLVWDVGTGSGAICVAVAVECRRRGYATDVRLRASDASADALALATENAVAHSVADVIQFAIADLTRLDDGERAEPADLLAANLPYIPSDVVPTLPVAASFEPRQALDGGTDGLAVIRRLLAELPSAVAEGGVALIEIGAGQEQLLRDAVTAPLPGWQLAIHADMAGNPRVAELRQPGTR
jgi:release factor glutamine methyltransferase